MNGPSVVVKNQPKNLISQETRQRNTLFVNQTSRANFRNAVENDLMQVSIKGRDGTTVIMPDGKQVVEFINCSYLGLDVHPHVVAAYRNSDPQWGVNFCCARSRFSIERLRILEEELSTWYRGRAVTFPTVTTTHISVMPLLASGILIDEHNPPKVRFIFDKLAHSSMQFLKPILQQEGTLCTIPHNSLEDLRKQVLDAKQHGETAVYVADGIYSMGGICPVNEILAMAEELDFYLYLDDAHGTTIIGERGEGAVLSQVEGALPDRIFLAFCLSKGYGASGGGILVGDKNKESLIRTYGQIYAFSAALDFASVEACLTVLNLHRDGTVNKLQKVLRNKVAYYDKLMNLEEKFSPIRMVKIGNEQRAIRVARRILELGFFVSVAFFPVVARNNAQLRICLAANHSNEQIEGLINAIKQALVEINE